MSDTTTVENDTPEGARLRIRDETSVAENLLDDLQSTLFHLEEDLRENGTPHASELAVMREALRNAKESVQVASAHAKALREMQE